MLSIVKKQGIWLQTNLKLNVFGDVSKNRTCSDVIQSDHDGAERVPNVRGVKNRKVGAIQSMSKNRTCAEMMQMGHGRSE